MDFPADVARTMNDLFFLAILAAFALLSWGLMVLCDRLMRGKP